MQFKDMQLDPKLISAIEKQGYTEATPIQEQVITHFVTGEHIVWQSQTGTGKTAAFVIPLLNAIDPNLKTLQVIVLCPTRELAVQTEEECYKLSRGMNGIKTCAAYGGSNIFRQKERLMQGAQILIATPGRAIDLIQRRFAKTSEVKYLVLDEADRMLDMGFVDDVEFIWDQCPQIKQIMSFSATITHELRDILTKHIGGEYHHIQISQEVLGDKIDHMFIKIPWDQKLDVLKGFIEEHKDQKICIFRQTKIGVMELADELNDAGLQAFELHGDVKQSTRNQTIRAYKENRAKILIATDVASRGLNLNDIDLVINYDVPQDPESYIHRIGRTARAGKSGKAIMIVTNNEMKYIYAIERRNKIVIKEVDIHGNELDRPKNSSMSGRTFGRTQWAGRGSYGAGKTSQRSFGGGRSFERSWSRGSFWSSDYNPRSKDAGAEQKWYKPGGSSSFDNRKSFGGASDRPAGPLGDRPARTGDRSTGTMGRHNDNAGFKPRRSPAGGTERKSHEFAPRERSFGATRKPGGFKGR